MSSASYFVILGPKAARITKITWKEPTNSNPFWQYHIKYIDATPYENGWTNRLAEFWIRGLVEHDDIKPDKFLKTCSI